ncbi:hypothetical protein K710_0650 [Streptococcus iniae SF1]|nr:hypothetical protein K710_0650 [Streptococcus iniae SF1]EKB52995.1 hypothetical protein A0G_0830 [Streptococcus iniae 9117]
MFLEEKRLKYFSYFFIPKLSLLRQELFSIDSPVRKNQFGFHVVSLFS